MDSVQPAAEVIALPSGGGAVHGIGEAFAPDLHTGTGNFTIPIEVPSGRNGVQPALQLSYSTGNGNGPFGLGWSLGVPALTRKTARGVPRYADDDVFLLSGVDDLVEVQRTANSTRYRPRTEGLFALIERLGAGAAAYWQERTKDGLVNLYGARTPAGGGQPAAAANATVRSGNRVFGWHLAETRDPFGNRLEYLYVPDEPADGSVRARDEANGHAWHGILLNSIRYIDYDDAGQTRFLASIGFEYEDRPDPFSSCRAGFELRCARRCARILVSTHADPARAQPVRAYELAYEADVPSGVSLVSRISLVGFEDNTATTTGKEMRELPPLELSYTRFEPAKRRLETVRGSELPPRALSAPGFDLVDVTGDGLPDVLELNGRERYWRNRGGTFDAPRALSSSPGGVGLANRGAHLLDADGNGRADLLVEDYRGFFPIDVDARWDDRSLRRYAGFPSVPLGAADVRLVDLDGDGLTDVLRTGASFECWFNDADAAQAWTRTRVVRRRRADAFPDVDLADRRVRLVDMNGDGLQDVALIGQHEFCYWPSLGHGDWGERVWMRTPPALPFRFDSERVLLGDVDGDGLADFIYVDDDTVSVWINRGGDAWSDPVVVRGTPSPAAADVRLADLHGNGVVGVLWTRERGMFGPDSIFFLDLTGGTKPYLLDTIDNNLGAVTSVEYRPSTRYAIEDARRGEPWQTALPFPVQVVARVETSDRISHTKVTSEFRYRHGYWDGYERTFCGFARVDRRDTRTPDAAGQPASPPLEARTWFHLGAIETRIGRWRESDFSSEYWPDDPVWFDRPPETTLLLAGLRPAGRRDALRSLRGSILRSELFALDNLRRPYTVTEATYGISGLDAGVFFAHRRVTRTTQWEQGDDPMTSITYADGYDGFGRPRDETAVALPRRTVRRRSVEGALVGTIDPDEKHVLATLARHVYAAPDSGAYPELYMHDRVEHALRLELDQPPEVTESDPQQLATVLADQAAAAQSVRQAFQTALATWKVGDSIPAGVRVTGHKRTLYDGAAFGGRTDGKVGPAGAITRRETLVFTADVLDDALATRRPAYLGGPAAAPTGAPAAFGATIGYRQVNASSGKSCAGWYADTVRQQLDSHGVVVATQDALGRQKDIELDSFGLLPVRVTDAADLETVAEYNYRALKPARITDENGNARVYRYGSLGLLERAWFEGRNGEGGTEAKPETRHLYSFRAYEASRDSPAPQPIFVHTTRRLHHASEGISDEAIESREYSDGFGRLVQKRTQAEKVLFADVALPATAGATPGDASGKASSDKVVVSGWQVYDDRGRVVEKYEPFFADGWDYQPEEEAKQGEKVSMAYDPRGRLTRTLFPDGSERRVVFGIPTTPATPGNVRPTPWESYVYDANDLDGRAPSAHRSTPASRLVDALGRVVCQVERNGANAAQDWFVTRWRYDVRGNLLEVVDPFGRAAFGYAYDLVDRRLRTESIDAGLRTHVPDALGNDAESRDGKGSAVLREYDVLGRLVRLWARDEPTQQLTLRELVEYGDAGDPAQPAVVRAANRAANRLGRPAEHWDEAGLVVFEDYDFQGKLLEKVRRVVDDAAVAAGFVADWSAAGADADLEPNEHRMTTRYDALQRPAEITYPREAAPRVTGGTPQRAVVVPLYNGAGALERVTVDGQEFVSHIAYNARGQRVLVAYGNGLMTRYAYDDETFRLARMRTEAFDRVQPWLWRGHGSPLQDSTYSYDPMGNLVEIEDRTIGCGVAADGRNRLRREFAYDPLYRLTSATGRAAAGTGSARPLDDVAAAGSYPSGPPAPTDANAPDLTELYEESYELDPVGNLLKLTYDAASGRWSRRFGIDGQPPAQWADAATNRATELRVGTSTPSTYVYDANGNLLQQNLDRFHTWDHADRLVGYQVASGAVPSVDARYLYGADGERVKKWVRRNGAADTETTVYVDGVFELHRWRENGAQKRQNHLHVLDNRSRVAIVRVGDAANDEGGPPVQYHLGDHVGSSAVVVDDSGNWLNREEYFPYGETSFGSFSRKRYRFLGRERDRESSLSYHGARYYAPWLARWTSCDPAETVDGVNLYRYARSSPLSFSDTSGKQSQTTTPTPQQQRPPPDVQTLRDPQPTATTALERLGGHEVNTPEHAEAVKAVVNWALQKATEAATDPKTGAITKTRREIFFAALERVVSLRKGHLPESAQNLIYRDADHYLAGRYVEYMAGAKEGLRVGGGKDAPISETSAAMSPFVILGYDVLKELGNYKQVAVGGKHFLSTTEGVDPAPAGGQEWALLGVHDFIRYDRDKQTDKSAPEPVTQTPTERFVEALKPKPYKPKPSVLETLVHSMTAELGF